MTVRAESALQQQSPEEWRGEGTHRDPIHKKKNCFKIAFVSA